MKAFTMLLIKPAFPGRDNSFGGCSGAARSVASMQESFKCILVDNTIAALLLRVCHFFSCSSVVSSDLGDK